MRWAVAGQGDHAYRGRVARRVARLAHWLAGATVHPEAMHPAPLPLLDHRTRLVERRRTVAAAGWLAWAARLGYATKGLVYLTMGVLAVGLAIGLADRAAGSQRVLALFVALPFGRLLGAAVAAGLLGYATLSLVAAWEDPEEHGRGVYGLYTRAGDAVTGVVYLGLTLVALRLVASPGGSGGMLGEHWLDRILATPAGPWLTGTAGIGLLATGLGLVWRAATARFAVNLDRRLLEPAARRWIARLARAGAAARGVAFGFCGLLLLGATVGDDGDVVRGLGDALGELARLRLGPWLLALVGVGFMAYGAYQLAKARFRRLELP
jgi:hypothetical protein